MIKLLILASTWWSCVGFSTPKPSFCQDVRHTFNEISFAQRHGRSRATNLPATISSNEDLLPGIQAIDAANDQIFEQVDSLRQTPYFRLYSVDILASCEYMPQELFECYSETCEIYPVEDEDVSVFSLLCMVCAPPKEKIVEKVWRKWETNKGGCRNLFTLFS